MISTLLLGWKDIILWPLLTITSLLFYFLKIVTFVAWWLSSHYLNEQPSNGCHALCFFCQFHSQALRRNYHKHATQMSSVSMVVRVFMLFFSYICYSMNIKWWILCFMSIFFATFVTFVTWQSLPYCSNEHGDGCHVVCVFVFLALPTKARILCLDSL